ncbi:MAG: hypothetical protein ACM3S4_03900 [Burkholderiales bacterium]
MRKTIISIYPFFQFVFLGILVILIFLLMVIGVVNIIITARKKTVLTMYKDIYIEEVLTRIMDRIPHYSKRISLLMFVFLFIYIICLDPVYLFLSTIFNQYKDMFLIVIGAFLAGIFGYISNKVSENQSRIKSAVIHSNLLYQDIDNIKTIFFLYNNVEEMKSHICYYSDWRNSYAKIAEFLTKDYYYRISNLYENIEIFNTGDKKQREKACLHIKMILDNEASLMPSTSLSLEEVLAALKRISEKKRPKNYSIIRFINEVKTIKLYQKHFDLIEKTLVQEIKKSKDNDSNLINNQVVLSLIEDNKRLVKRKSFNRLIFLVATHSDKVSLVWGTYSLKNTSKKK